MMTLGLVFGRVYGCGSLLVLILDIIAIVQVVDSGRSTGKKSSGFC
jgi:hypothetical protein